MKRAIVLSGGGGKGAYQIGVWKAIRKLHLTYDIVTGTSVGALNGAYMVQKDYRKALFAWKNMAFDQIYDTEVKNNIDTIEGKKELAKMYAKGIVVDGGMNVDKLENLIEETLNEKKFRKSKIDYGLVTFNLSKLKAETMVKSEIPTGKVKDFLIASATCYPVFKKKEIEKEAFIDGGIYDNLPINLALEMGADEIIAVDLRALGIKKKTKENDAVIRTIAPKNKMNSFLVFDRNASNRAIKLGYNDTMKAFHKLEGNLYTFKKGSLEKNYYKYQKKFLNNIHTIFHSNKDKKMMDNVFSISAFHKLFKKVSIKENMKLFHKTIEQLGSVFELDDTKIYDMRVYNKRLLEKIHSIKVLDEMDLNHLISTKNIRNMIHRQNVIKYIYLKMKNGVGKKKENTELCTLALLFSKEFLGALYIYTIEG